MISNAAELNSRSVGSGEAVLLIHGIMSDQESFNGIREILGKEFHTITYDRRGYGIESDPPYEDYSFNRQAEDAAAVLQRHTDQPAYIVGDSTGGIIALQTAVLFPQLVKGIFLVETTVPCKAMDLSCLHVWEEGVREIAGTGDIYKMALLFAKVTGAKPVAQKSQLQNIKRTIYNIRNFVYGEREAVTESLDSCDAMKKLCCPVMMGN